MLSEKCSDALSAFRTCRVPSTSGPSSRQALGKRNQSRLSSYAYASFYGTLPHAPGFNPLWPEWLGTLGADFRPEIILARSGAQVVFPQCLVFRSREIKLTDLIDSDKLKNENVYRAAALVTHVSGLICYPSVRLFTGFGLVGGPAPPRLALGGTGKGN
jgi:hypothetical protein